MRIVQTFQSPLRILLVHSCSIGLLLVVLVARIVVWDSLATCWSRLSCGLSSFFGVLDCWLAALVLRRIAVSRGSVGVRRCVCEGFRVFGQRVAAYNGRGALKCGLPAVMVRDSRCARLRLSGAGILGHCHCWCRWDTERAHRGFWSRITDVHGPRHEIRE